MNNNPRGKLEEFSQTLIKLGKEIEKRIAEKQKLEQDVKAKEAQIKNLQGEIFSAQMQLAGLSSELAQLETQRGKLEDKKPVFEGLMREITEEKDEKKNKNAKKN